VRSPRVVITDADYPDLNIERAILEPAGIRLDVPQVKSGPRLIEAVHDADGLIVQYAMITRDVVVELSRCRIIARYGVGLDTIDVSAAEQRGIAVRNVPDYCTEEVADHTVALGLTMLRGIHPLARDVAAGLWSLLPARPLRRISGLTMGMIGCGRIGTAVAARAAAFGMRLLAYDPFVADESLIARGVQPAPLERVLAEADVLSLHRPAELSGAPAIGRAELARVKHGVVLVNTARGSLVDEEALREALITGRVRAAALDVLRTEPPLSPSLAQLPHVVVTPHVAWYSEQSEIQLRTTVAEMVRDAVLANRPDRPQS
jgi:D-3-phosphoglycerate dehydrogenase / 2-oxoglutarate reductase